MLRDNQSVGWYRSPLQRETMRELNRRSDWKGLLQVGAHLSLLLLTGSLVWYAVGHWSWWTLPPLLFVYGTFYAFLLNASHELSHGTVFRTRFLNAFFLRLFCFLGWRNHVMFWKSHAEHHKYTLRPPDDLEVTLPVPVRLGEFLKFAIVDVWRFCETLRETIRFSMGKLEGTWENHLFASPDVKDFRQLINWSRFLLAGHVTIVAASIYFELWLVPVLTTFASFYGGWLRYLCNNTQHAGLQDNVSDFRLCCRTVVLSPFARFLYWHMNYHIEHHMYVAVPCYNLGKLHALIKHELPDSPRGLLAAWRQIVAIVKRQKEQPDYRHVPDFSDPVT
ncbi:MAG: hypothetical protein CMJ81_15540 [Planctomycetaceae bacterium]|nr:hypothetical protein [Planctomycetaceae bacterium]